MRVLAWAAIVMSVLCVFVGPHRIGKERGPKNASEYVINDIVAGSVMVLLAGRVLGAW